MNEIHGNSRVAGEVHKTLRAMFHVCFHIILHFYYAFGDFSQREWRTLLGKPCPLAEHI